MTNRLAASPLQQYMVVTANYWAFTLTDGALRMLVVLHFYQLGYNAFTIALLFLFYEFFGVVTNLVGGWVGARVGLNRTMNYGLILQVAALSMLLVPAEWLTVFWVMCAQALSGIAKDLNKMSAKSAIKTLVPSDQNSRLYHWVALLTGSKNALKGVGFFLGALLLSVIGFWQTVLVMACFLAVIWLSSLILLTTDMGRAKHKPKFKDVFSDNPMLNKLAAARLFLFASRDVWFVVALPVFLAEFAGWDHWRIGSFMATWVIGYGFVQSVAPRFTQRLSWSASTWTLLLATVPALLVAAFVAELLTTPFLVGGLLVFGALFAINSALHSYLVVHLARTDGVSLDVGFYYTANALGRLIGTLLSGAVYQWQGLAACLFVTTLMVLLSARLVRSVTDD